MNIMKYIRCIAFTIFFLVSLSVMADNGAYRGVSWLPMLVQADTQPASDIDRRPVGVVRRPWQTMSHVNDKVCGFNHDDSVDASLKFLYLRGNYLRGNYFDESGAASDDDAHIGLTTDFYGRDVGIFLISASLTFGLGVKELKKLRS